MVRTHFAHHGAARGRPLRVQIAYLAREGAAKREQGAAPAADADLDAPARTGAPAHAVFYSADATGIDVRALTTHWAKDIGHHRIMVSPEDGALLGDLAPFVREVMDGLARRLETRLDWIAVNHRDTDNPHAHILVRGVRDTGDALELAPGVGARLVRRLAEDIATRALGPRSEADVIAARWREVNRMGLTGLDRGVMASLGEDGLAHVLRPDLIARLERLEGWGLASRAGAGWRLADDLTDKLRRLEARAGLEERLAPSRRTGEHLPLLEAEVSRTIEGELVHLGPGDDFFHDSLLAVIETGAGELRFARLAHADDLASLANVRPGALVQLGPRAREALGLDRAIARIAAREAGLYAPALHRAAEPQASEGVVNAALRRLEAMERAGLIARTREGAFIVGGDHDARALAFDALRASRFPVAAAVTSYWTLAEQVSAQGPTRLDRTLTGEGGGIEGHGALARRYAGAVLQRRAFLIAQGVMRQDEARLDPARLALMGQGERRELAARLARERGRSVTSAPLARVRGVYRRYHDLAQGRLALIEAGRSAHLVPWSVQLEAYEGRLVEGVLRREGYQWTRGGQRSLELGL